MKQLDIIFGTITGLKADKGVRAITIANSSDIAFFLKEISTHFPSI